MKLEMSPKQGLTTAMQTSMRLLQLNNLQLRQYIGELMTSNPVVELEYPEIDYRPSPFDRQNAPARPRPHTDAMYQSLDQLLADRATDSSPLHELLLQCAAMRLCDRGRSVVQYLIHTLDENGFLTEPVETSARVLGVPVDVVQQGVRMLQSMEPAGVGAADLKDCLRLQLLRSAPEDETALRIVSHHLEEMAKQQYAAIAKALGVPKTQVVRSCERIRKLSPKPLNGLSGEVLTQYILPDFYVLEGDGALRYQLNDYFLPKIKVDATYQPMIRDRSLPPDDRAYLQQHYRQADEVLKFLAFRKTTLQRVIEYTLQAQRGFFLHGPGHRAAMSNREIAQALDLHESTISRAVSGKFFECKWGVFPFKSLFVRTTKWEESAAGSFDQVLHRLQQLIADEPPGKAYSDQQLAALLDAEGVLIARRTVAKYRQMLGIPTAGKRNAQAAAK